MGSLRSRIGLFVKRNFPVTITYSYITFFQLQSATVFNHRYFGLLLADFEVLRPVGANACCSPKLAGPTYQPNFAKIRLNLGIWDWKPPNWNTPCPTISHLRAYPSHDFHHFIRSKQVFKIFAYRSVSDKLHLRDGRTDEETRLFGRRDASLRPSVRPCVRPFLRLFVRCVCQGRPSYRGTNRDAS